MKKIPGLRISFSKITAIIVVALLAVAAVRSYYFWKEKETLKKIIARLQADTRIAQVLVTDVSLDEATGRTLTTIKFLEYGSDAKPLAPKYFTFSGNVIQFQSLVVRFQDFYVERGDPVRGKSAYLFLKVFFLDGPRTEVFDIAKVHEIPLGYKLASEGRSFSLKTEEHFWQEFWQYALQPTQAEKLGIKNVQIEAPGTKFVPGTLYTIRIEHDGGMRIDAEPLEEILKGERIVF